MTLRIDTFFSQADREAIKAATAAAERTTAGELVVYVAERCDLHSEAAWKGAMIGGALGALCASVAVWRFGGWGAPDQLWILIGFQLGLVTGWIASRFDAVARRLIGEEALGSRVDGRAAEAFLDEEVFATRERTGVLIFVALFEHRVVVLADEGVKKRVAEDAWDEISTELALGIRSGRPAAALIRAVERCAAVLEAGGVHPADSVNEISNEPRFRGE